MQRFASFREFYPFYLGEHAHPVSRRLHFAGSCGVLVLLVLALVQRNAWWLLTELYRTRDEPEILSWDHGPGRRVGGMPEKRLRGAARRTDAFFGR